MMTFSRYSFPILIAVTIHAVIFLVFFKINNENEFQLKPNTITAEIVFSHPIEKKISIHKKSFKKTRNIVQDETATQLPGKKFKFDRLMVLLSQEIAKQQEFLEQCSTNGKLDKTRIGFMLLPSGEIQHVTIIHPSHYSQCNELATQAIEMISPFKEAEKYLKVAREFEIDIYFSV